MQDQEIIRKRKRASTQKSSNLVTSEACFKKRRLTMEKKAYELSKLCDIDVCVICYGPDGTLYTWPKDRANVREIAMKYKRLDDKSNSKRRLNLDEFSKKMQHDGEKNCRNKGSKIQSWDERLDGYSKEELMELDNSLLSKIQKLQERVELLKQQKQDNGVPLVESQREDQTCNSSEIAGNNVSDLIGESDFEAWLHQFLLEDDGSSNIGDITSVQNQGFTYSDMSGNSNFSDVNSLVPTEHTAGNDSFMMPQGNLYCQSSVSQTPYQNLSAQVFDTSFSYSNLHPVHTEDGRICINNNFMAMGTVEEPYWDFQMLQPMGNGVSQHVHNTTVLNNGNFQVGFPPLMVPNSLHQGLTAPSLWQTQQSL